MSQHAAVTATDDSQPSSPILSPLRYPGGKRRLVRYIAAALRLNNLRPDLYVEPFAGGASVAIQLLSDNLVERIALGERDPLVASFWKTVFYDHEWLNKQIESIDVSVETWKRLRVGRPKGRREKALTCLFLNRTSFSGILNETAGPIGGLEQKSEYAITCRFPRETLKQRISAIAQLRDRVLFVHQGSWSRIMRHVWEHNYNPQQLFFYLDPPFFQKAEKLYRYAFKDADHKELHRCLQSLNANYILSYDAAQEIIDLYSEQGKSPERIELLYSIKKSGKRIQAQELIISNLAELPPPSQLYLTTSRRKRKGYYEVPIEPSSSTQYQ